MHQQLQSDCRPASCGTIPFKQYGDAELTDLSYRVGLVMFYALNKTLGDEAFDRAYRSFLQEHHDTGATSADTIAAFHDVSPASDRILADWFSTTRWYTRLKSGESLRHIVDGYSQ